MQLRHALEQTFGDSTEHDPQVEAVIAAMFATLTAKQAAQFRQELNNFQRERLFRYGIPITDLGAHAPTVL